MSGNEPKSPSAAAVAARRRRIERGQAQEDAARQVNQPTGLQSMLAFPLLQVLDEAGGKARPRDIYEEVADRLSLPQEARGVSREARNGRAYNVFQQQVRWTRQTLIAKGLMSRERRGIWELTDPAYAKLKRIRKGAAYLVWSTDLGVALWAHAEDVASAVEPGSVQLIFTSPVYPIQSGRDYGKMTVPVWLDWMQRMMALWRNLLTPDGTIMLNVADVHIPGLPAISPYLHRFMLHCIDDLGFYEQMPDYWYNPGKLGNIQWTGTERRNPKAAVEHIKVLSPNPFPKRTVNHILVPAQGTERKRRADAGRRQEARPGGYKIRSGAFYGRAEKIPDNLIVSGGAPSNDEYSRKCRAAGLPVHSARFPLALPTRGILQATDPGDLVADFFAGSFVTAQAAEKLGRRWVGSEIHLTSIQGGSMRLDQAAGFRWHLHEAKPA